MHALWNEAKYYNSKCMISWVSFTVVCSHSLTLSCANHLNKRARVHRIDSDDAQNSDNKRLNQCLAQSSGSHHIKF
jgi:hypothetical protein